LSIRQMLNGYEKQITQVEKICGWRWVSYTTPLEIMKLTIYP